MTWNEALSEQFTTYLATIRVADEGIGSVLSFVESPAAAPPPDAPLPLPIAVKDNIAVADAPLTCGSRMLQNVAAPYTATVVQRLIDAGARVVAKTNLDEFGMGSSCDTSALGRTNNPWDHTRVAGGSSGGSAAAVAAGLVPLALGSDTGGSVRQPAAFCGVYGLKPTYGRLSRYGLVAYASSLETIGFLAHETAPIRAALAAAGGRDPLDQTTVGMPDLSAPTRRLGVIDASEGLDPAVRDAYRAAQDAYRAVGYTLEPVTLETLRWAVAAYYTIATAEASANLARYAGVRYGHAPVYAENPQELTRRARSEGFGDEVQLRILLGTFVLRKGFADQYYHRAQAVRSRVRTEFGALFDRYDAILSPVFPTQPFVHDDEAMDAFAQKLADRFTVPANLAGVPALSMPTGLADGLPTAVQVIAPHGADERLLALADELATVLPPAPLPSTVATWPEAR